MNDVLLVENVVFNLFVKMLNPRSRGKDWSWLRFPQMCDAEARRQVKMRITEDLSAPSAQERIQLAGDAAHGRGLFAIVESDLVTSRGDDYLPSDRVRLEAHLWRSLVARADDVGLTSDCEHDGDRFGRLLKYVTPRSNHD